MNLQNKLDKKDILIRGIYNPNFLINLQDVIFKKKILDQKILKGAGKGKWLLSSFLIKDNNINIISICSGRLLINLLEKGLLSNKRFSINLHLDFQFLKGNLKRKKIKHIALADIKNILKTEYEILPIDKESGTFEIKSRSLLTKKRLLNFLISLLDKFQSKFPYILLNIKTRGLILDIKLEGNNLEIKGNFKETSYLKHLNTLFFSKNKSIPSYCLWYAKVQKLDGGWSGRRRGNLIQESGNDKEYKREQYDF